MTTELDIKINLPVLARQASGAVTAAFKAGFTDSLKPQVKNNAAVYLDPALAAAYDEGFDLGTLMARVYGSPPDVLLRLVTETDEQPAS